MSRIRGLGCRGIPGIVPSFQKSSLRLRAAARDGATDERSFRADERLRAGV
jgi:hypothetical protein